MGISTLGGNRKMERVYAKWLGHSTVLLRIGGATILTDPVFSTRIGVSLGPITIGMKRLTPPAMALERIPRPDLVLLSHAHFDHFDIPVCGGWKIRGP